MKRLAARSWMHVLLTGLLSAYLTFVVYSKSFINAFAERIYAYEPTQPFLLYMLFGIVLFVCFFAGLSALAANWKVCFKHSGTKRRLSPAVFAGVAAAVFLLYLFYLFAKHPGGFSPDTQTQW